LQCVTGGKAYADLSQGIAGLTERDIKLVQEGGFHTVESIAYTYAGTLVVAELAADHVHRPKRMLEQIKGISEAKAGKLLNEGEQLH